MSGSIADPSIYPEASSIGPNDLILVAQAAGIGQPPVLRSVPPAVLAAYVATIVGTIEGLPGPAGEAGAPGSQIYALGAAPANSFGNNGDYYINTATGVIFGPKSAGVWPGAGLPFAGIDAAGVGTLFAAWVAEAPSAFSTVFSNWMNSLPPNAAGAAGTMANIGGLPQQVQP